MAKTSLATIHLALVLCQVSFGFGSIIGRFGMKGTNPLLFALIRECIAGPLLCLISYKITSKILKLSELKTFIIPGFCLYGGQLGYIIGLKLTAKPFLAASFQLLQPIFGIIIGYLFKLESLNYLKLFGIISSTIGGVIMVLPYNNNNNNNNININNIIIGCLFFMFNSLCSVFYLIASKYKCNNYNSFIITGYSYVIASIFMLITNILIYLINNVYIISLICNDCSNKSYWYIPYNSIGPLIYYILFQSIFSYSLMTWCNQYVDVSINMAYSTLQPISSAILSSFLIVFGFVNVCNNNNNNNCLNSRTLSDLGIIGILIGLYIAYQSEKNKHKKSNCTTSDDHHHQQQLNTHLKPLLDYSD